MLSQSVSANTGAFCCYLRHHQREEDPGCDDGFLATQSAVHIEHIAFFFLVNVNKNFQLSQILTLA